MSCTQEGAPEIKSISANKNLQMLQGTVCNYFTLHLFKLNTAVRQLTSWLIYYDS